MDNLLLIALSSGFAGVVVTKLFDYLVAKLSAKTKQDKMTDLLQTHISIHKMSAEQLEETLNQVWITTNENLALKRELSEIKDKREKRDGQISAMEAHIAAQQAQINKDAAERSDLREKLSAFDEKYRAFEAKYRAMWQYLLALLETMKRHRIDPPSPPKELESDPEIMKIVQDIKAKGGK